TCGGGRWGPRGRGRRFCVVRGRAVVRAGAARDRPAASGVECTERVLPERLGLAHPRMVLTRGDGAVCGAAVARCAGRPPGHALTSAVPTRSRLWRAADRLSGTRGEP